MSYCEPPLLRPRPAGSRYASFRFSLYFLPFLPSSSPPSPAARSRIQSDFSRLAGRSVPPSISRFSVGPPGPSALEESANRRVLGGIPFENRGVNSPRYSSLRGRHSTISSQRFQRVQSISSAKQIAINEAAFPGIGPVNLKNAGQKTTRPSRARFPFSRPTLSFLRPGPHEEFQENEARNRNPERRDRSSLFVFPRQTENGLVGKTCRVSRQQCKTTHARFKDRSPIILEPDANLVLYPADRFLFLLLGRARALAFTGPRVFS